MRAIVLLSALASAIGANAAVQGECGIIRSDCLHNDYTSTLKKINQAGQAHRRALAAGIPSANSCNIGDASGRTAYDVILEFCEKVCKPPKVHDRYYTCSAGPRHSFQADFNAKLTTRNSLQWPVFFLILAFILGPLFKMCLPKLVPYTVGLLLFGFFLGALAQSLIQSTDCPMYALSHDINGDGMVSRAEWDEFICVGCDPNSYCMNPAAITKEAQDLVKQTLAAELKDSVLQYPWIYPTTCGDGTANPPGCAFSFEALNSPWKLSSMIAETANPAIGAAHHRALRGLASSSSSGSGSNDEQLLSPDELWVPRCNLLDGMISVQNLDPHVMLVLFLPALLFESACFGIDLGIFRKQKLQILIMAFPSMIVASGLTGICIYAMAPATWTFWVAWLIGIIVSATDPVAVVALLKELGAAKSLGTLIEGESLINDGSAVVLFSWVRNSIGYSHSTLPPAWMAGPPYTGQVGIELLRIIAQMLVFGTVFGWVMGKCTASMLRFVYNDHFIEASVIIGMSYLTFWLGEVVMGSSAVLAVVCMGLVMNGNKSTISPRVLHFLHEFYEMVAYLLNTVIFLIAGCKLGSLFMDSNFDFLWTGGYSAHMIIAIYPIVLFARGAAIAIFFPVLRKLGTGCTWKEAVAMWWGGLRGSVGLALGLVVHHQLYDRSMWGEGQINKVGNVYQFAPTLDCRDQPMMVLVLTIMVVVTTVVINGVTMAPLMKMLQLTEVPEERRYMLRVARNKLRRGMETGMEKVLQVERAKDKSASIAPEHSAKNRQRAMEAAGDDLLQSELDSMIWLNPTDPNANKIIADYDRSVWLQVLSLERAFYLAQFEKGLLDSEAFHVLEAFMADVVAEAAKATTDQLGKLYDKMFHDLLIVPMDNRLLNPSLYARVRSFVFQKLTVRPRVAFAVATAYIEGQEEVKHLLEVGHGYGDAYGDVHSDGNHGDHPDDSRGAGSGHQGSADTVEEDSVTPQVRLANFHKTSIKKTGTSVREAMTRNAAKLMVVEEHLDNIAEMQEVIQRLLAAEQDIVVDYKKSHFHCTMLLKQRELVEHMMHEGELLDLDALPILDQIDADIQRHYRKDAFLAMIHPWLPFHLYQRVKHRLDLKGASDVTQWAKIIKMQGGAARKMVSIIVDSTANAVVEASHAVTHTANDAVGLAGDAVGLGNKGKSRSSEMSTVQVAFADVPQNRE